MAEKKPLIEKVEEKRENKKERKKKKEELLERVEEWEENGWDVGKLKGRIDEDPFKGEKLIEEYERRIEKLRSLKKTYESLELERYDAEPLSSRVEKKLNDPEAVEEVEKKIKKIKDAVQRKKERKRLLKEAKRWKAVGFRVGKLIQTLKEDLEKGKEMFEEYRDNIEKLKLLRKKYSLIEKRGRTLDMIEIEHKLNDPTAVKELEKKIDEFEKKQSFTGDEESENAMMAEFPSQEIISFSSKESWKKIVEEEWRKEEIFTIIKNEIKNNKDVEDTLVDWIQTDSEMRQKFLHYIDYWNKNISEKDEYTYFKLSNEEDLKIFKIYDSSPVLSCLYGVALLLKEKKIAVSKSTHGHNFFRDYQNKLFGDKAEKVTMKETDVHDIYEI